MFFFVLRRIVMAIPTFAIVAVIIFTLIRALPGDPALMMLGGNIDDEATLEMMRRQLGLDQPLPIQFLAWLREVFSGNLGVSILTGQDVGALLLDRFSVTATVVCWRWCLRLWWRFPPGSSPRTGTTLRRITRLSC